MSRKEFIQSYGATCKNWYWSWSFINESEKTIIFGAWDRDTNGKRAMILSADWQTRHDGKRNASYSQSREHIRLVEEEGYRLMTFPMKYSNDNKGEDGNGPAKIEGFTPILTEKAVLRMGDDWFAVDSADAKPLPLAEELPTSEKYPEGARYTVTINGYERNAKARAACIAYHGYKCSVCDFTFSKMYGAWGNDFIHVHHIKPIGTIGRQYEIDPKNDLIPVCPNCHAMIHRTKTPLTVAELRRRLRK